MSGLQFTIDPEQGEGFYVVVGGEITIYEQYDDAVSEIQAKIADDTESFLAAVDIENTSSEDVAITLEQVGWQQIIRDMAELTDGV